MGTIKRKKPQQKKPYGANTRGLDRRYIPGTSEWSRNQQEVDDLAHNAISREDFLKLVRRK